jgi:hypothetical protein
MRSEVDRGGILVAQSVETRAFLNISKVSYLFPGARLGRHGYGGKWDGPAGRELLHKPLRDSTTPSTVGEAWTRRELDQLPLADGLASGGAGRNRQLERIAARSTGTAFGRRLGDL